MALGQVAYLCSVEVGAEGALGVGRFRRLERLAKGGRVRLLRVRARGRGRGRVRVRARVRGRGRA